MSGRGCPHCPSDYSTGARVCCHCGHTVGALTVADALPGYFMALGMLLTLGVHALRLAELFRFIGIVP